jgi:hypothetical protein
MPLAPAIEFAFTGAATYSISGNAGTAGATVSYTGPSSGSVTADGSGNYTISGLANGTYIITPSAAGYNFIPSSQTVVVSGGNVGGVNFIAIPSGGGGNQRPWFGPKLAASLRGVRG